MTSVSGRSNRCCANAVSPERKPGRRRYSALRKFTRSVFCCAVKPTTRRARGERSTDSSLRATGLPFASRRASDRRADQVPRSWRGDRSRARERLVDRRIGYDPLDVKEAPELMSQETDDKVAECLAQATAAKCKADSAVSPGEVQFWQRMERRWLRLGRAYRETDRMTSDLNSVPTPRRIRR